MPIRRTRRRSARYRADVDVGLRSRLLDLVGQWVARLTAEGRAQSSVLFIGPLLAFLIPSLIAGLPLLQLVQHPQLQLISGVPYMIAVLLVIAPGRRRLDELPVITAVVAMISCLALTHDSGPERLPLLSQHWGYQGLHLFPVALAVRQRTVWAWGTVFIATALGATFGARSEHGMLMGMAPMATVAGTLVVAILIITEIERLLDRRREARALGASARTDDDAEQDTVNASIRRMHEVRRVVGPALERIAYDSSPVDDEEIRRFRVLEAHLRDSIRGRSISTPELHEAARRARERGVSVDILDERGSVLPERVLRIVGRQSAAVLDAAQAGSVTIRAFPADDQSAVLIVHDPGDDDEDAIALEIAQETGEISEF